MNLLNKTKTYLAGPMEFGSNNLSWREEVEDFLSGMNITVMSPFNPPFIEKIDEGKQGFLKSVRENGDLYDLEERMKKIRRFDLGMVDKCDFMIVKLDPEVPTFGTLDELVHAEGMNKPIFLWCKGGKRKCPLYIYSLVSPKYMYDSLEDLLNKIKEINSGQMEIDSKRWRLLKMEYR
jgi:nucleoside 2-deoxyribosyltransferase